MASASLYAPAVPGVTQPHAFASAKLSGPLEALKKPAGSDDRARALTAVADEWFQAWKWYYEEAIELEAHENGHHWGYLDRARSLWVADTLDDDPDRVRITVNATKALIDTATAKGTQDAPIFRCAAGQAGIAAAAAAETSRAFLDHAWRFHFLDDLYRDTFRSSFSTGTDFVLLEWDESKGPLQMLMQPDGKTPQMEPVPDEESGEAAPDAEIPEAVGEDGSLVPPAASAAPEQKLRPKYGPQGDLLYRQMLRSQVAFDPRSRRPGGQDGIGICVKWREPRENILRLRPDIFDKLPPNDQPRDSIVRNEEQTQRAGQSATTSAGTEKGEDDSLEVIAWYLRSRPDQDRPRGDCILVCSGKILWEGENDVYPTEDEMKRGELWPPYNWPVFAFLADSRKNCPWGLSRTRDAIPLQHALNGCYSKAMQHIALMANAKYVLPSGLDSEPDDSPGQTFRVPPRFWSMTGGRPVQMTQPVQMPPEYMIVADHVIDRMEAAVGINAASMGQAPSADPSGRLAQSLQHRDDTRIANLKRSHDNQWALVQEYALRLIRRNATGQRQLLIVGDDQSVAIQFFQVANLAAGTQVYAINDTSLPRDPKEKMLFLSNLTQTLAQVQDEETKDLILDLLRMPDIAEFQQRKSPHHMKAIENNRLLLLGEGDGTQLGQLPPGAPPPPQNVPIPAPWDNAMIHKAELERFVTSKTYLNKVKAEKLDPANQQQSPLEQRATWLWSYWSARVNEIAQAQQPPAPVLPGPGSASSQPSAPSAEAA